MDSEIVWNRMGKHVGSIGTENFSFLNCFSAFIQVLPNGKIKFTEVGQAQTVTINVFSYFNENLHSWVACVNR